MTTTVQTSRKLVRSTSKIRALVSTPRAGLLPEESGSANSARGGALTQISPKHKDFPHGTVEGFQAKCSCNKCLTASLGVVKGPPRISTSGQEYLPQLVGRKKLSPKDPNFPHSSTKTTGYQYGCRCEICTAANATYQAQRRRIVGSVAADIPYIPGRGGFRFYKKKEDSDAT